MTEERIFKGMVNADLAKFYAINYTVNVFKPINLFEILALFISSFGKMQGFLIVQQWNPIVSSLLPDFL